MPQFAERVLALAHDPALRARMGEAGRRKVREEYRFSAIIRRYEAWWDELAEAARLGGLPAAPLQSSTAFVPTRIFGHYPSRTLGPDDRVVATDSPADPPYSEIRPWCDDLLIAMVLAAARTPLSVRALIGALPADPSRGWFTVMWLLKYDRLRLAPR
jgi:hypothetical protein